MSKNEFDNACEQLITSGFELVESCYNEKAFGSWHIMIGTIPNRQIVWDGRDKILSVEEKTEELFNESPIWKTIFTSETINHQEIPELIKVLIGDV